MKNLFNKIERKNEMKYKIISEVEIPNTLKNIMIGSFFKFKHSKNVYIKLKLDTVNGFNRIKIPDNEIPVMILENNSLTSEETLFSYPREAEVILLEQLNTIELKIAKNTQDITVNESDFKLKSNHEITLTYDPKLK